MKMRFCISEAVDQDVPGSEHCWKYTLRFMIPVPGLVFTCSCVLRPLLKTLHLKSQGGFPSGTIYNWREKWIHVNHVKKKLVPTLSNLQLICVYYEPNHVPHNLYVKILTLSTLDCGCTWRWVCVCVCVCVLVAQLCPILCDPIDCSPSGSSVHEMLQTSL